MDVDQLIQGALGLLSILLGGTLIGAILKFKSDKAKINSDTLVAMRGHDVGEEEAEGNYWEKLILSYDKRLKAVEETVLAQQTEIDNLRREKAEVERKNFALEKNVNVQNIYIDTLTSLVPTPPGPPTRPTLV